MPTVLTRFLQTPACHDGCEEEKQPSRQAPMRNAALRRVCFVVPLPPSPAAPTQATPAKLSCPVLNAPALSRLPCGTRTASTLDAGLCAGSSRHLRWSGFRGVEHPASQAGKLDFIESSAHPHKLSQNPNSPGHRPGSKGCGLPDSAKPREDGRPLHLAPPAHHRAR